MHTANGLPLLCADTTEPRIGPWRSEIEVDASEPLSGAVELDFEGVVFKGTVLRSGEHGGSVKASVVGGAGGLSKELEAGNYAAGVIRVETVVRDILRAAGETLAPDSHASILGRQLTKWQRAAGLASHQLVALLDEVGAIFRVNRAGEVWIGVDSYPEVDPEHVLTDEDWSAGILTLEVERPELEPGTTFRGQRIEQCIHRLRHNSFVTEAHLTTLRSSLDKFLGRIRQNIDYSRLYPCRVVGQNPDGTLQLRPDSPKMRGKGLDRVPLKHGLPGIEVTVSQGAKVRLGFDNGNPGEPYAALWDTNAEFVKIKVAGGTQPVARMGDLTVSGGPGTMVTMLPAFGVSPGASVLPGPLAPALGIGLPYLVSFSDIPPTPLTADPLPGYIATGNEKFDA